MTVTKALRYQAQPSKRCAWLPRARGKTRLRVR